MEVNYVAGPTFGHGDGNRAGARRACDVCGIVLMNATIHKWLRMVNKYCHLAYFGAVAIATPTTKVYGVFAGVLLVAGIVMAVTGDSENE